MVRVHNSFDENQVKKADNKNKSSAKVGFSGHKVIENQYGEKAYRFFLPELSVSSDKIKLLIVPVSTDKNGKYEALKDKGESIDFEKGQNYIDIPHSKLGIIDNESVGYKFKVDGNDVLDTSTLTKDREWNVTTPAQRVMLEQGRPMVHIVPDMIISKATMDKNPDAFAEKKILSSKIGGNFSEIMARVPDFYDLGARRILSTPIFGQDNLSSHGYWTTNPFQITNSVGDIAQFKKLNNELYKKGMGWIADGAFVNEGLEGIHLEHINKWGSKSPYSKWVTTFDFPDKPFKFGILSKKDDVNTAHLGIRLVNAPKKLVVTETGKEKWVDNTVDYSKPTYVQIYDKRLASAKQVNSDEVIRKYAKIAEDPHEINDYQDTFMPYRFKINPDEVGAKYKEFQKTEDINQNKGKEHKPFKNFLTEWSNHSSGASDDDGGATLWVGNKDILKLRFMLTAEEQDKILSSTSNTREQDLRDAKRAVCQVQDNIIQVGEFWTKEIATNLQTKVAKELTGAKDAEDFEEQIQKAVKAKQLPQSASKITKEEIENLLDDIHEHKDAPVPHSVFEGIVDYPLDAIEFNHATSGILGSPYLKKLAMNESQIGKPRVQLFRENREVAYEDKKPVEYGKIPKEYRKVHQEMDNLLRGEIKQDVRDILTKIQDDNKLKFNIIEEGSKELTQEGRAVYGMISNDIAKFIFTKALLNRAADRSPRIFDDKDNFEPNYENKDALEFDTKTLSKVSPESLKLNAVSPEDEALKMVTAIREGSKQISEEEKQEFAEYLSDRLAGMTPESIKVAKFVVAKTEGGLEWRIDAAKDVAPVESITDKRADFEANWQKTTDFWKKFTDGVRKHNPKSYEILEITDEKQLVDKNAAIDGQKKIGTSNEAVQRLIQGSGATTPTNYNYFYSYPHELYSANTEKWAHSNFEALAEKLIHGWDGGKPNESYGHLLAGTADSALQSHNMISNHDKPRPAHGFGLDMKLFFAKWHDIKDWSEKDRAGLELKAHEDGHEESAIKVQDNIKFFYGETPDFRNKVDGKALSMGIAVKTAIDKSHEFKKLSPEHQEDVNRALKSLVNGEFTKADGSKGEYVPEFFGVRPYDVNIKDVMIEAKRTSKHKFSKVDTMVLEKELLASMLVPALKKTRAATGFLVAMPGNPTIYAGDEIGETGFETKTKNAYGQDRNPNHYNRVDKESSAFIQEIYDAKNDIAKVMNLRHDKACSPLVDGNTIVLTQPSKLNKEGEKVETNEVGVIYRYNENKDMFVILNNTGFGMTAERAGIKDGEEPLAIPYIDLSQQMQIKKGKNISASEPVDSMLSHLKDGTEYKNALKKDEDTAYKIDTVDGKKVLKRADGEPITMRGSDLFLCRTTNFNGEPNQPSFSGNPHVKLQNTKYRFSV